MLNASCLSRSCSTEGTVNKVGHDHLGLLVHGVFNVSIGGDAMPSHFSYDVDADAWSSTAGVASVAVGSRVRFTVTGYVAAQHCSAVWRTG